MTFPDGFAWGVAAASYQIEGGAYEDGKGPSVWDVFCTRPGAVWEGHTGEVACDHYHRYRDDVALMARLGVRNYRLSVSWPRLLPDGTGAVNPKGLDFYDRLIDALLAAGITPWVTLFHWDYPHELFCRGGWLNPDSPEWFAGYAGVLADALGDRVARWITHNEPQCFIGLGHQSGYHAPGLRLSFREVLRATHNALLAHGRAVQVLRDRAQVAATVGLATCGTIMMPQSEGEADLEAARRAMFDVTGRDAFQPAWWLDPIYFGRYPDDGPRLCGADAPRVREGDMETISQPTDFLGCNIYHGRYVRAGADGQPEVLPLPLGYPMTTQTNWQVTPECLYWGPRLHFERYGAPVVITENGHQNADSVMLDGRVHDPQRIDYVRRHLLQLERAIADGVDVRGYFQWTFMDNFEWALGYGVRVGIVHTDFVTQARTPKDSAYWYKKVSETNGASLHESPA